MFKAFLIGLINLNLGQKRIAHLILIHYNAKFRFPLRISYLLFQFHCHILIPWKEILPQKKMCRQQWSLFAELDPPPSRTSLLNAWMGHRANTFLLLKNKYCLNVIYSTIKIILPTLLASSIIETQQHSHYANNSNHFSSSEDNSIFLRTLKNVLRKNSQNPFKIPLRWITFLSVCQNFFHLYPR